MQEIGKVSSLSVNKKDFQNWGKIEKKVIMKRPAELIYSLKTNEDSKKSKYAKDNMTIEAYIKKKNDPEQ